jgi:hypothetical protein
MALDMVDFINGAIVHAKAAFHTLICIIESTLCGNGFREIFQIILLQIDKLPPSQAAGTERSECRGMKGE